MQNQLNRDNFEKYFFYGMENKDQVVKWIIMGTAKELRKTHKEADKEGEKPRYEQDKDAMLELIVQLERFTSLHDDQEKRHYSYDVINTESEQVNEMFDRNAEIIKDNAALSFIKDGPFRGIFTGILFNTHGYSEEIREKYHKYSGEQYLDELRRNPNTAWGEDVYNVLCYLEEIEKENTYEYYSLFLDAKYARAIHRNTTEFGDEREIHEIRNVYRKFLKRIPVSGVDIKLAIRNLNDKEMISYIDEHYPEYDTITTLKEDAMNDNYNKRVEQEVKKVCDMFLTKEREM